VTRIRTIKNVIITIPNAKVLNNHITNYSAASDESGLILNTTVTIGYDAPWRQVHKLLIGAADATPGVLEDPEPFVFQTSLDDYYVSYELNAYTKEPLRMAEIYSRLHQNIQDKFIEAGIEIMSPAYSALRDGNQGVVAREYKQPAYFGSVLRYLSPEDTRPLR
jgi:small-conductance mechanosensitive channel